MSKNTSSADNQQGSPCLLLNYLQHYVTGQMTPQRLHAKLLQSKLIFLEHYTMVHSAAIRDSEFHKLEQVGLKSYEDFLKN